MRKSFLSCVAAFLSALLLELDSIRVFRSKRRLPTWLRRSSRASVLHQEFLSSRVCELF